MAYMKKEKVLSRIRKLCEVRSEPPMSRDDMVELKLLQKLEKEFSEIPTADVEEVRHGEWSLHPDGSGTCNLCGRTQKFVWDFDNAQGYCGKCGAKMDGGIKYD